MCASCSTGAEVSYLPPLVAQPATTNPNVSAIADIAKTKPCFFIETSIAGSIPRAVFPAVKSIPATPEPVCSPPYAGNI
jgi:hypothetical protein